MLANNVTGRADLASNIRRLLDSHVDIISPAKSIDPGLAAELGSVTFQVSISPGFDGRISDSGFRGSNLIRQLESKMRKDGKALRGVI